MVQDQSKRTDYSNKPVWCQVQKRRECGLLQRERGDTGPLGKALLIWRQVAIENTLIWFSYEDRLPPFVVWFSYDPHMKPGWDTKNTLCGLTFHLILIWRQVEPQRTLLTSVSGDTFLSTATTTVGCSTTSLTMGNSSTIPRLQMLAQVMVCFTQVFMIRLTMTMTVTVVVAVKGFVLILRSKYNTGSEPFSTFAVRDIEKGEEVTNIIQVSIYLQNMCIL